MIAPITVGGVRLTQLSGNRGSESLYTERAGTPEFAIRMIESLDLTLVAAKGVTLYPRRDSIVLAERLEVFIKNSEKGNMRTCDIGTGTGLFACVIKRAAGDFSDDNSLVVATDISSQALLVAEKNAEINDIPGIVFKQKDMAITLVQEFGKFDLIVSNPPFYSSGRFHPNSFDPPFALDGGKDGLSFYRKLIAEIPDLLTDSGIMILQTLAIHTESLEKIIGELLPRVPYQFMSNDKGKVIALVLGNNRSVAQFVNGADI